MAHAKLREVIERAVNDGSFGDNGELMDLILSDVQGEDHFASEVVFAEIKVKVSPSVKSVQVVVKIQQKEEFIRRMMNTDYQFYNEVIVYKEIFPFLEQNGIIKSIFPNLIYGNATLGQHFDEDILVVEDLRQYGYRLSEEKIFLDFDHCALVLRNLGRFHALSYIKKQKDRGSFFERVGKLKEVRYTEEKKDIEEASFLSASMERGILPLLEIEEYKAVLSEFSDKFKDSIGMMQLLCKPEEPTAVLCHGDFCRNNMVFSYDAVGKPDDVRFYDVATARYASPAIDLSFFLFMNTSAELRRARWEELLKIYHDALTAAISSSPESFVPSLKEIHSELVNKALYGYALCSFFIPMMMDVCDGTHTKNDFTELKPEDLEKFKEVENSEEATKVISDIVKDIIKMNSA